MTHHWWTVLLGSASMFSLVSIGPVWAVPKDDIDMGWGQAAAHGKYQNGDGKYGHDDDYQKHDNEKYVKREVREERLQVREEQLRGVAS